jgi:hypothetical protein
MIFIICKIPKKIFKYNLAENIFGRDNFANTKNITREQQKTSKHVIENDGDQK